MTGMLRHGRRNDDRQAGFTFVEMLVTVIMIGLLSAIMIPIFLGSRDKASGATAEALLRTGAATVEAVAVDTDGYATITPAQLGASEPNVAWQSAPGAQAPANQVTVGDLGPNGYTLSTTTSSGTTYVLQKDLTSAPTVTRTCGAGCSW
jgi:type IV pilus assembly protein PilA